MNAASLQQVMGAISAVMDENKEYLVELDSQNGDGDLGISMAGGYKAAYESLQANPATDLGKLFLDASVAFNEKAPSSLGTITSFGMMGMAKALKGKEEASLPEVAAALQAGLATIMKKAGSKPGEKTILDSLSPAIEALTAAENQDPKTAFSTAAKAAAQGSENTRNMLSVHGRAAYYGDKSLGVLDGGSVVGRLLFESISQWLNTQ